MLSGAEKKSEVIDCNQELKRWSFEKFARAHREQHAVFEGLKAYGHSGIDERSKVRRLLNGIKTQSLDSIKAQMLSFQDL